MKIGPILALIPPLISPLATVSAVDTQRTLIQNRGSDSMAIAVVGWAEQYKVKNTAIGVTVSGGGAPVPVSLPCSMVRWMLPMLVGR